MVRMLMPLLLYLWVATSVAQTLNSIVTTNSFADWELLRQAVSDPMTKGNRPVLPGVSSKELELLQDAIARKYLAKSNGSLPAARRILTNKNINDIPILRGLMSEAIFLDKHKNWGYIAKPNASQHDVYAKMPSGGPGIRTGQIKFHMDGKPGKYASDMLKDYRSGRFLVPDDHVYQLKTYLKNKADRLKAVGDTKRAKARYRDMNRVYGIGATAEEIDKATRRAINESKVIRAAPFVFLGTATALLIGPTTVNWLQGEIGDAEAAYYLGRGGAAIASATIADQALKRLKGGLLRGTVRGNVIVTSVALLVDSSWQIYEQGNIAGALQKPEFVIYLGGSVSATAASLAGGYVGMAGGAVVGGPVGAVIGGVVVGTAAGVVGYFAGSEGARGLMKLLSPEKLYKHERVLVQNVRSDIEQNIAKLQVMPSFP